MPVITLDIIPLSKQQKQQIAKEFTEIASNVTGLPKEAFYVYIKEIDAESVAVGGTLVSDRES